MTVNLAESPLGWLYAHIHVTGRQYDAVERLRFDLERSQLDPRVTMTWDAAPIEGAGAVRDARPTSMARRLMRGAGSMPRSPG